MIKKKNNLDALLERILSEAQPPIRPQSMADFAPIEKKDISLDQAVDRYLIQYEKEAIPTSEIFENINANIDKLTKYLFEQEEDLDLGGGLDLGDSGSGDPGAIEGGLDLGAEEPNQDNSTSENQEPVIQTPQINLQDFARSTARLIGNFQSLLDVHSILINRAEAYIKSNYNERTAKELMEILDTNYDLRPADRTNRTGSEEDSLPQPVSAVTGPAGG